MSETVQSKWIYFRWVVLRMMLVIFDIAAINVSFIAALLTRFYVAKEFHEAFSQYFTAFLGYTPLYTLFCLVVFGCFRLYNSMWKYAGLNDLNRVAAANLVCFIGHVAGTMLFGMRMPITFYCIGGVLQATLITVSRFSYRLLLVEKEKLFGGSKTSLNALVVGAGETGRRVIGALEHEGAIKAACALNYKDPSYDSLMDGVPVVNGLENLKSAVEKYNVNFVILASTVMPQEVRESIKESCRELGVEVQDYSGYFQNVGGSITLKSLAEYSTGAMELIIDGQSRKFTDGEQALMGVVGKYIVKSISAKADTLVVELTSREVVQNDLSEGWVKAQEQETGEAISFF